MTVKISGNSSSSTPSFAGDDGDSGLHATADQVQLVTNGTVGVTVDSSQNVGIGTSSPSSLLHVEGTAGNAKIRLGTGGDHTLIGPDSSGHTIINAGTAGGNMQLQLAGSTKATIDSSGRLLVGPASSLNSGCVFQTHGDSIRDWAIKYTGTSGNAETGIKFLDKNNFANAQISNSLQNDGLGAQAADLVFKTSTGGTLSERMRITSSGFTKHTSTGTYIGATDSYHEFRSGASDSVALYLDHTSASPYGLFIGFSSASPDNNTNYFIRSADTIATRFTVYSDGDVVTSDQGTLTSDATLKRDITDATPKLADVMNLQVRNYYWKEDYHPHKQNKLIGFIAQEFEEVFPGLVTEHEIKEGEPILDEQGNDTGEKTPGVYKKCIREGKLIPILVKALQEAVERIETLETVNAEQATTIASFEARISALEGGN